MQKARLLIVEDEAAIRSGLVDLFVYHGYEVETAAHGDEGLRLGLGGNFDLILLDVMLPGIDGFEICNRIRQQDRQQPIIMLTQNYRMLFAPLWMKDAVILGQE